MTTKINRPRPTTRLGLASDVRSADYKTRTVKSKAAQAAKNRVPVKARTVHGDRRVPR
jgi:hypothetical protein